MVIILLDGSRLEVVFVPKTSRLSNFAKDCQGINFFPVFF
jgi:hypothetical protein